MGALGFSRPQSSSGLVPGLFSVARPAVTRSAALVPPLDELLVSGSDTRLAVEPRTQLNIYGCTPHPRAAAISFASTTASSISARGYAAARNARAQFVEANRRGNEHLVFDRALAGLRARLKGAFAVDDADSEVILAPSGTDAQLLALFVARATFDAPVTSIVVAAEETGSGTSYTALGQHFNSRAAHGAPVVKGSAITGLAEGNRRVDIAVRNSNGTARTLDEIDASVIAAIHIARAQGRKIALFAMDQSKSGLGGPSNDCLRYIGQHLRGCVQVVIDACQGRLSHCAINEHLANGRIVLITGSKFFTGPPFSGAVFVPPQLTELLDDVREVPLGLCDYSSRSEWPERWAGIRKQLPETLNAGLWLRWESALAEIEAYNSVPKTFRALALERFADALPRLFTRFSFCRPVDPDSPANATRTIFPFLIMYGGSALSYESARKVYGALNLDLSTELISPSDSDRRFASNLCHIGQPFMIRDKKGCETGALRISADARLISEAWETGSEQAAREYIDQKVDDVRAVLEKIKLILVHHNLEDLR